jgi:hypothetical protein
MSKVITHPLLVRPASATRSLIGVVPNQIAAAYNASSCQVKMSNVKARPLRFTIIRWEAAWAASGSPAASPVFLPTLLTDTSLAFFGAQRDGQIVAGCIANRSRAGVVGFSNFFAPDSGRDRYRGEAVALVANFAKGNPLVGYDRGAELQGLQASGFRSVGPLRVWVRP